MTLAWHARETPDRPAILAPALVALAYVGLDDLDRAIQWLERALDERGFWTMYVNVEPGFTSLRTG